MTEALEKKGIDVNKESLATRVKNMRRIDDLEEAQEKKALRELGLEDFVDSDDDSDDLMSDEELKKDEGEKRGRKEKRDKKRSESAHKIKNTCGQKRKASIH